jgi:heme A synthase
MDDAVPFASREYFLMLAVLAFARGMDFLSTWVATPHLVLEGNPIAKKLGWGWGVIVNVAVCVVLAKWPLSTIVVSTASILVAARNFQSAWLMRSMGEHGYREWYVQRVRETRVSLYLFCLFGQTILTALIGGVVVYFGYFSGPALVPLGIGMGIMAYAVAVTFYTLLAVWRLHRAAKRKEQLKSASSRDLSAALTGEDV